MKYVSYSFLNDNEPNSKNINGELVFQELAKTNPLTKFEGTASSQRIASLGEYQKYFSTGSMLIYYGNPSFLNILSPKLVLSMN